jgi:tetratricopeptide (TPR) repeat protein
MGDTTKALSAFQTCVEQDPKNADAYLEIGLLLHERKDKMAAKYLDNAVKANPKAHRSHSTPRDSHGGESTISGAHQAFKRIIEVDYKNEEALYAPRGQLSADGLCTSGVQIFRHGHTDGPKYAEAYCKKGRCAEQMKHNEEARSLYQQCLNFKPDYKLALEG